MRLDELLHPESRVIELGAHDQELGILLAAHEVTRYLALVEARQLDRVRALGPLGDRVQALPDPLDVARIRTDLLILQPPFTNAMWAIHDGVGARYLALPRHRSLATTEARLARLLARLLGRASRVGSLQLGTSMFDVVEVHATTDRQPRMYFSPAWGPEGFAARLADAGLNYVILRWFENLPTIQAGEDLDVLVADEDLDAFRALVESEPGTQPLDLYSVSGLPYSDFHNSAYYPPPLAREILRTSVDHSSGFRVPAPTEHLRSLAYHAVYHKGYASGLVSEEGDQRPVDAPDHDYASALASLAAADGSVLTATLEGVDRYLAEVGWRPPEDTLRRLADVNPWVGRLVSEVDETLPERAEIAVFLLRARLSEVVTTQEFCDLMDHFGFDPLLFHELGDEEAERATTQLRGGNWGQGPFPQSGGNPVALVAALHHGPVPPYEWLAARYPHLTNAETWELKDALRQIIESRVAATETFNPIHSSDNMREAWEYLAVVIPDMVSDLRRVAHERAQALTAPDNLLRPLSTGRRARVDVVESGGVPRVRKTFVPAFRRFLVREITGRMQLSGRIPAIPALEATGPTWIETPYYEDTLTWQDGELVPLPLVREMVEVLRSVHSAGYDVVDAKPHNFLVDAREGLKLIDLEFLHEYGDRPPPFGRSVNFIEPEPGFTGDVPVGDMSYEKRWLPHVGMPLEVLIDGTEREQRRHRALWTLRRLTVRPGSPPRQVLARARAIARHQKWLAKRRLRDWSQQRARHAESSPTQR